MTLDNRFRIIKLIGRGGTSCVYLAEHIRLHNYWAVKEVFHHKVAGMTGSKNALIAESDILTKLSHPGLPKIIDIMDTPESFLIVMEYIEGVSLDKLLAQRGCLPQADVLRWGCQLCDVLDYLHSQLPPIIYRDMKPANIVLRPDGNVVLIDFGMAREYKGTSIHDTTNLGTHGYAAPEQYKIDAQTDARTDIYSLGVTLYHLVTGCDPCVPPYGIRPICSVNPSLSPKLDSIIRRCTQIDPAFRYQNVKVLKNDLNAVIYNRPVAPVPWGTDLAPQPQQRRKPVWLFVLIPVLVVALIGIVAAISLSSDPNSPDNNLYMEQEVVIDVANTQPYYFYECERSGYYLIESISGNNDAPVIWLSDENDIEIASDNVNGAYEDAQLRYYLEKGEVYIIQTTLYDLDPYMNKTGRYWITVQLD